MGRPARVRPAARAARLSTSGSNGRAHWSEGARPVLKLRILQLGRARALTTKYQSPEMHPGPSSMDAAALPRCSADGAPCEVAVPVEAAADQPGARRADRRCPAGRWTRCRCLECEAAADVRGAPGNGRAGQCPKAQATSSRRGPRRNSGPGKGWGGALLLGLTSPWAALEPRTWPGS